jgi:CRISPR-associated Cas5-like protein
MNVISFRAKVPYECGFRRENGVNTHSTYPVPPFTTWVGLLGNAMGLAQDQLLPFQIGLAVSILRPGNLHQSLTLIHKRAHPSEIRNLYQSTLVTKERLYFAAYDVCVLTSEDTDFEAVHQALLQPKRPLYLGTSDDMVDICEVRIKKANEIKSTTFHSLVPFELGRAVSEVNVVQLPVKYSYSPVALERGLFYWPRTLIDENNIIPDQANSVILEEPADGYQIESRVVSFVPC